MDFSMLPGVPVTVPLIFTTFGWLHPSMVEMRRTVVQDDDDRRVTRTDKFTLDGQFCGNDIHIDVKRWPEGMQVIPGQVGG